MNLLNVLGNWVISVDGHTALLLSKIQRLEYDIYDSGIYAYGDKTEQCLRVYAFEENEDTDEAIIEIMQKLVTEIDNHRKYGVKVTSGYAVTD